MTTEGVARSGSGDLSRSLELLWGTGEPATRGPKAALSLERIVEVAVALADREGLAALSMRRVATELGVGTMSLYRHVPGKGELLDLMLDHVGGLNEDPSGWDDIDGWREVLEKFARGLWKLFHDHPWLIWVNQARPLLGPNGLAAMDLLLDHLEDAPVDDKGKILLIMTIEHYVTGTVRTYLLQKQAEEESGISDEEFWAAQYPMLSAAMDSGDYPNMAALDMSAFDIGPEQALEFGLQPLLDGLVAHLTPSAG